MVVPKPGQRGSAMSPRKRRPAGSTSKRGESAAGGASDADGGRWALAAAGFAAVPAGAAGGGEHDHPTHAADAAEGGLHRGRVGAGEVAAGERDHAVAHHERRGGDAELALEDGRGVAGGVRVIDGDSVPRSGHSQGQDTQRQYPGGEPSRAHSRLHLDYREHRARGESSRGSRDHLMCGRPKVVGLKANRGWAAPG